jgi:GT2 family glycosyltransferase
VGVVAIGRNEGERLRACLEAVVRAGAPAAYVDSGSTDGSVALAQRLGVQVVELDMSVPFTAARARNAGFKCLLESHPDLQFVQFIDGDCEMADGWLDVASRALEERPEIAIVAGRCRERHPDASVYNRICDLEWDTPVGESEKCGGIFLVRAAALRQVDGFNSALIAGEEPEMCLRLREKGWKIWRVGEEMNLHDAAMTRFGQWWRRMIRGGHAFAEVSGMHPRSPKRIWVRETRSSLCWGLVLPITIVSLACLALIVALVAPSQGWLPRLWRGAAASAVALAALYPLLLAKVYRNQRRRRRNPRDAALYAASVVLAKPAQAIGVLKFRASRRSGKRTGLIEYKNPAPAPTKNPGTVAEETEEALAS